MVGRGTGFTDARSVSRATTRHRRTDDRPMPSGSGPRDVVTQSSASGPRTRHLCRQRLPRRHGPSLLAAGPHLCHGPQPAQRRPTTGGRHACPGDATSRHGHLREADDTDAHPDRSGSVHDAPDVLPSGVPDGIGHQPGDGQDAVLGRAARSPDGERDAHGTPGCARAPGLARQGPAVPGAAARTCPRCRLRHVGPLSRSGRAPGPVARSPGRCPLLYTARRDVIVDEPGATPNGRQHRVRA